MALSRHQERNFHELEGRLAAEAFHIVSEGLSNVLRHTSAKMAFVMSSARNRCCKR